MFRRLLKNPLKNKQSFFLFGARGTGKSFWLRHELKDAIILNLLEPGLRFELLARPESLEEKIPPGYKGWVIIDEIQKVPNLLDLVHKLIEEKHYKFILTSSSARKLKKLDTNLLAGRAHTYHMYPLVSSELADKFDLKTALRYGMLPSIYDKPLTQAKAYLNSYTKTYIYEEVLQEGLSRNLEAFSRFLEAASFSQASVLNISAVAREAGINTRTVSNYFDLLEDMLLSYRLPVFSRRAKRKLITHSKFYFFDTGVYQTIRPRGIIDSNEEIEGIAVETLVLQEIIAINEYYAGEYKIFYWRTVNGNEVDFVLYGPKGFIAIEVKSSKTVRAADTKNLKIFLEDYPEAKAYIVYGGNETLHFNGVKAVGIVEFLKTLVETLSL